jgi:hypothetical protein
MRLVAAFAVLFLVFVGVVVAYLYAANATGKPLAPSDPKVLAVIDGKPGSGKTTVCGYIGTAVKVVEKDYDYFTQPVVNPQHVLARTPEGAARRARWLMLESDSVEDMVRFVRAEAEDYIASLPKDSRVVFCGVSRWGDYDLLPRSARGVPRYLLDPGKEETAKRVALRHLEFFAKDIPDCANAQTEYSAVKNSAILSWYEQSRSPAGFDIVTDDGAVLIVAVLGGFDRSAAERAVKEYRSQPSVDQRIRKLTTKLYGDDCKFVA